MRPSRIIYLVFFLVVMFISYVVLFEFGFAVLMSLFGFSLTAIAGISYYLLGKEHHRIKKIAAAASEIFWFLLLAEVVFNSNVFENPVPLALFLLSSYILWIVSLEKIG